MLIRRHAGRGSDRTVTVIGVLPEGHYFNVT